MAATKCLYFYTFLCCLQVEKLRDHLGDFPLTVVRLFRARLIHIRVGGFWICHGLMTESFICLKCLKALWSNRAVASRVLPSLSATSAVLSPSTLDRRITSR